MGSPGPNLNLDGSPPGIRLDKWPRERRRVTPCEWRRWFRGVPSRPTSRSQYLRADSSASVSGGWVPDCLERVTPRSSRWRSLIGVPFASRSPEQDHGGRGTAIHRTTPLREAAASARGSFAKGEPYGSGVIARGPRWPQRRPGVAAARSAHRQSSSKYAPNLLPGGDLPPLFAVASTVAFGRSCAAARLLGMTPSVVSGTAHAGPEPSEGVGDWAGPASSL